MAARTRTRVAECENWLGSGETSRESAEGAAFEFCVRKEGRRRESWVDAAHDGEGDDDVCLGVDRELVHAKWRVRARVLEGGEGGWFELESVVAAVQHGDRARRRRGRESRP